MKKLLTLRGIQVALAVLWLIDGLFQLQPQMFTANFASQVIAPAATGQPFFVRSVMDFAIQIISYNTVLFGILFAVIQLAIGVLILVKPTIRVGLILSIIWGFVVWYFGEGAGGVFSGQTMLLIGAPGAALLYSLISIAVYPRKKARARSSKASLQPAAWLVIVWIIMWVGGSVYQLLPGQNSVDDIGPMIAGNADGAPGWLAAVDTNVGNFITNLGSTSADPHMSAMGASTMAHMQPTDQHPGLWFILLLSLLQFLIGVLILMPEHARKIVIIVGIVTSIIFWVVGQSLGEYYSGLATDPSTAPLIILLGLTILANTQIDTIYAKIRKKINDHLMALGSPEVT